MNPEQVKAILAGMAKVALSYADFLSITLNDGVELMEIDTLNELFFIIDKVTGEYAMLPQQYKDATTMIHLTSARILLKNLKERVARKLGIKASGERSVSGEIKNGVVITGNQNVVQQSAQQSVFSNMRVNGNVQTGEMRQNSVQQHIGQVNGGTVIGNISQSGRININADRMEGVTIGDTYTNDEDTSDYGYEAQKTQLFQNLFAELIEAAAELNPTLNRDFVAPEPTQYDNWQSAQDFVTIPSTVETPTVEDFSQPQRESFSSGFDSFWTEPSSSSIPDLSSPSPIQDSPTSFDSTPTTDFWADS